MNRYLRDYQRDGVRFLYQHYSENTGAILGDDMGLGKTVQVVFISLLFNLRVLFGRGRPIPLGLSFIRLKKIKYS